MPDRTVPAVTNELRNSNPNFDLMRQHVLRDPRLLQQLANVMSLLLVAEISTQTKMYC